MGRLQAPLRVLRCIEVLCSRGLASAVMGADTAPGQQRVSLHVTPLGFTWLHPQPQQDAAAAEEEEDESAEMLLRRLPVRDRVRGLSLPLSPWLSCWRYPRGRR